MDPPGRWVTVLDGKVLCSLKGRHDTAGKERELTRAVHTHRERRVENRRTGKDGHAEAGHKKASVTCGVVLPHFI